jgi:hypothetical protein
MAQVAEHLPSKCKALSSNPTTVKKLLKDKSDRRYEELNIRM